MRLVMKQKAYVWTRKVLVETVFLEVNDDLYKFKTHDAGQTRYEPNN